MYKRYVDDQVEVCPPIQPGWTYNVQTKKMEYSKHMAETDTDTPSIRTAKILQLIGNTIEPDIQLTYDTPEGNVNNKIPVLD